jgi:dTDP-glucose 4,6-dehydratase
VRLHDWLRRQPWLERYVRISTPEVYGSQDTLQPESWNVNPSTPYAVSHAATDMSLRAFHSHYGFPVVFTRFANFYGPGQQLYRIVPRTILAALSGRRLQLHGGGTSVRAFIYATDIADGIMRAASDGRVGEAYHFSPDTFLSIRDLVSLICERAGVSFADVVDVAPERPAKDAAYLMDATRARTELGWQPRVPLSEGIDRTVAWARAHFDEIQTLNWSYEHKA